MKHYNLTSGNFDDTLYEYSHEIWEKDEIIRKEHENDKGEEDR